MLKTKILFLLIHIVLIITLSGCGSTSSSTTSSGGILTGHLIDSAVNGVSYQCVKMDNTIITTGSTNSTGDFTYRTDCTVTFTIGKITLASINGANVTQLQGSDVYITDVVGVDRNDTNDSRVINILRVLQSLDSDDNPENGIDINQTTVSNLNSSTVNYLTLTRTDLTEQDLNTTVKAGNSSKELITSTKAIAHFEEVLRDKAGLNIDTVPPAKPEVFAYNTDPLVVPTATSTDTTTIKIIGEKGSKVYINNIQKGIISTSTGYAIVELNTTGTSESNFRFDILLQDNKDRNSTINQINIFKDLVAPTVQSSSITVSVYEQQQFIQNINASDASALTYGIVADSEDNRSIDYSLFQISTDGNVTFITEPNYETNMWTTYKVVAFAKDVAGHQTNVLLTITIINLLDNPPALTGTTFTANSITEKTSNATIIFDANSTMKSISNAPDNAFGYTFSLLNGTNEFDINSTTGIITIKDNTQPLFDYETSPNTYNLQLRVTNENNSSGGNTADANITINIANHIDTAPALNIPASVNLNEKTTLGTIISTITKNSSENDANTTMTFSIINGNDGNFTINSTTGAVSTTTSDLDFETTSTYTLTIRATNTWWDSSIHTDDVNLSINLMDQIDNAPVLANPSSTIVLPENASNGTTVKQIDKNGTNADENTTVSYYIDSGLSSGNYNNFTISTNGLVTTNTDNLTYTETDLNSSISTTRLAIKATNTAYNGTSLTSDPVFVDINITNIIDNVPVISVSSTNLLVDENATVGTTITTINKVGTIWDANQTDSFTLYDDNSSGKFDINSSTGVVALANTLDWESVKSYSFKIKATNIAGDSNILTFTITVNNIIEQAPIITLNEITLNVHENTGIDTRLTYIKEPINTDTNNSDVTIIDDITINSGNSDDKFKIVKENNIAYITLKNILDYETNTTFTLGIIGTNSFGNSIEQNLTINVMNDVEKNVPLLVIGVQYNDINFTSSLTDIENLTTLFSSDTNYANDSTLNNYFQAVSMYKFNYIPASENYDTTPATNGMVLVNIPREHPKTSVTQLKDDLEDSLIAADDNVTFSDFDTNSDGNISNNELQILFIVAGGERTYGDTNQSVTAFTGSFDTNVTLDGVNVAYTTGGGNYVAVGELNNGATLTIGLATKLLATTTFSFNTDSGIGNFGLMYNGYLGHDANESNGTTPVYPSAYNRLSQGWIFPNSIINTDSYNLIFDNTDAKHILDTHNHITKIITSNANKYYLIENRNTHGTSFDNGLYFIDNTAFSGGLVIWQVDNGVVSQIPITNTTDNIFRPTNSVGDLPNDVKDIFEFKDVGSIDSTSKAYSIGLTKK